MAEDLLFATLDPTMRQISLPGIDKAILSDTVGFVSDLPTQLVAAFRATLEEVNAADLIVHVRDIAHPDSEAQRSDVCDVLREIGIGDGEGAPILEVWNKIDTLGAEEGQAIAAEAARSEDVVPISALTGEGIDALARVIAERLSKGSRVRTVEIDAHNGAAMAWLHRHGEVLGQEADGERLTIDVRLSDADWARFQARS